MRETRPVTDTELWERQPGESAVAYEAWVVYRDMRSHRSVRAVGRTVGKAGSQVSAWSVRYGWVERARAFDIHEDRVAQEAVIEGLREMARRHVEIAVEATEALRLPVTILADRVCEDLDGVRAELDGLSAVALIRLSKILESALSLAVEVERTARLGQALMMEFRTSGVPAR